MATVTGTNSRGGLAKAGGSKPVSTGGSSSPSNSALSSTLASTIAKAKGLGIDTAQANSVLNQNKTNPGVAYKGSPEQATYNASVITPESMKPVSAIKIPTPPTPTGTPDITAMNAALSNPTTGLKADSSGGFTVDQVTQDAMTSGQDRFTKMLADLQGAKQPSAVDIQSKLDKQTGIDNLKQQEAQYTGQIDAIVKNSQAQSLALEGQGRGQTTQFLGGEQARIQREAAVAALPVQAQLAAVQGKIQVANDYINKWGALLIQDANNKYNQQVKTIEAVYNFGTAQDKLKFDNLAAQAKEKKDKATALATAKTKAISQALSQPGGASVVSAIQLATDENGVVSALGKYNGDLLQQEAQRASIRASNASTDASIASRNAINGTLNGKPQTDVQLKVQNYTDRMNSSNQIIDKIGNQFAAPTAYGNLLPRQLQGPERQQYEQAKLNFVNAKLRQESGAVIGDSEYKKADLQYFPQPGDSPEVLAQKAQNRQEVIYGGYHEANVPVPKIETPKQQVLAPADIPDGYYQANDGLLYKK